MSLQGGSSIASTVARWLQTDGLRELGDDMLYATSRTLQMLWDTFIVDTYLFFQVCLTISTWFGVSIFTLVLLLHFKNPDVYNDKYLNLMKTPTCSGFNSRVTSSASPLSPTVTSASSTQDSSFFSCSSPATTPSDTARPSGLFTPAPTPSRSRLLSRNSLFSTMKRSLLRSAQPQASGSDHLALVPYSPTLAAAHDTSTGHSGDTLALVPAQHSMAPRPVNENRMIAGPPPPSPALTAKSDVTMDLCGTRSPNRLLDVDLRELAGLSLVDTPPKASVEDLLAYVRGDERVERAAPAGTRVDIPIVVSAAPDEHERGADADDAALVPVPVAASHLRVPTDLFSALPTPGRGRLPTFLPLLATPSTAPAADPSTSPFDPVKPKKRTRRGKRKVKNGDGAAGKGQDAEGQGEGEEKEARAALRDDTNVQARFMRIVERTKGKGGVDMAQVVAGDAAAQSESCV